VTIGKRGLSRVEETMLFTLYGRALDARSASPVLGDRWADDVLRRLGPVGAKVRLTAADRYLTVLRARRMDGWTRAFLARHPDATVLQLACGLDSRAFRVDVPAGVRWFDVDLPEVVAIRRGLYPARAGYTTIAASVTGDGWLDQVPTDRPTLVVAEGLLMYLAEDDVDRLLERLSGRIPRGELVFDVLPPSIARLARIAGYTLWGLADPHELERRHPRLTLVEDAPVVADHDLIPLPPYRVAYRLLNRVPVVRDTLRPLRYRVGAG
jgi:O-methyltransferase involved in polyketide biosynthesis